MIENFEVKEIKEVPEDVAENWVDQLTIRQFNEELKDVFPYIYNLVNEETKAQELGPEDIVDSVEETTESTASDHEDDFNAFEEWADDTVDSALDEGYMKGYQKYNCKDCGCQMYGHREDPDGYYKGLQIIDKGIEKVIEILNENDLLILTGDHGTDPTDGKTDHSREYVPFVAYKISSLVFMCCSPRSLIISVPEA